MPRLSVRWSHPWPLILLTALAIAAQVATGLAAELRSPLKFTLTDQNGATFTESNLASRPAVIHFGFANCPVICPTTLYEVASRIQDLGGLADKVQFLFVTVDPERDTVDFLKTYMGNFDNRIVALTGGEKEIASLAASLGAIFRRVEGKDGDYTFDHSVSAYILRPNSRSVSEIYMGYDAKTGEVMRQLRELAATSSADITTPTASKQVSR